MEWKRGYSILFLLMQKFGGAKRDRTADLYNAIVALSQLSYSPNCCPAGSSANKRDGATGADPGCLLQPKPPAQALFNAASIF